MLSYLSNRHYHNLTQLLSPQLRIDQPKKIYYRTFVDNSTLKLLEENKKITHRMLGANNSKEIIKKQKVVEETGKDPKKNNLCPLCYEAHIFVQYHGYKHICVKCRNFVRDAYGNQIKIFLDDHGDIVCLGILPKSLDREKVGYYVTDHTKLEVDNTGVYATFAGQNELVLILKENKIV